MYELDKAAFGRFLAQLRREKGMTQKELAATLYVSDKAVSKWENPSLKDIGYVLGVQPFDCTPFYNASLDFADKTVKNFNFLFSGAIFMLDSFVNENLFNQSI